MMSELEADQASAEAARSTRTTWHLPSASITSRETQRWRPRIRPAIVGLLPLRLHFLVNAQHMPV